MAELLPRLPRGTYKFSYLTNNFELTPAEGGVVQMVNKPGSRFMLETTVRLRGQQGIGLVATVNANRGLKVRLPVPQPGIDVGSPGSPSVNSASAGMTISLKGLTAGYVLDAGQFISVVKAGKRYLHQVYEAATASGGGLVNAKITPPLRIPLAGNEVVEIAEPTIEGYLQSSSAEWTTDFQQTITLTVAVREAE